MEPTLELPAKQVVFPALMESELNADNNTTYDDYLEALIRVAPPSNRSLMGTITQAVFVFPFLQLHSL